jgi:hypothetical protein
MIVSFAGWKLKGSKSRCLVSRLFAESNAKGTGELEGEASGGVAGRDRAVDFSLRPDPLMSYPE